MKKRLAVVGIGIGGSYGARIFKNPHSQLVAVCARSMEKLEKRRAAYQAELGVSPNLYADIESLIAGERLDGLVIATPSSTHHEIAVKAINAGLSVLIDKPIDISLDHIQKIEAALGRSPVKCGVIYPLRFQPVYRALKKLVELQTIGRSLLCDVRLKWFRDQAYYDKGGWKGTWAFDGGGSLMNQGAHPMDLLCWLFGRPSKIIGDFGRLNHRIETEDWASGVVEFPCGVRCTITTTTCAKSAAGDQTFIDYHAEHGSVCLVNGDVREGKEHLTITPSPFDHPVEDFIDALVNDRPPAISLKDATHSVELITGLYQSAREGKSLHLQ